MRKRYCKLTAEQKERGVIFSSQLMPGGALHEVFTTEEDTTTHIERLRDDSFFNGSPYNYNEVRG